MFLKKILSSAFLSLLRWVIYSYRALSPLVSTNACCRFEVSCSEYVLQIFQHESWWKACDKSFRRFMRCNPFTS